MFKSGILSLLRMLSAKERRQFSTFVHSDAFHKHKKVRHLCRILLEKAPRFESEQLDKRKLFGQIYGPQPYDELKMNNLISYLQQCLNDFLAWREYRMQPALRQHLLLNALLKMEAPDQHLSRANRRFRQIQQKAATRNADFYLYQYRMYEKVDQQLLTRSKRSFNQNLQRQSDQFDMYYIANKLRIACDMASRNIVIQAAYECHSLDQLFAMLDAQPKLKEIPVIKIYSEAFRMLQSADARHYRQLIALLDKHSGLLPPAELLTVYNYALNFCIRRINSGEGSYYREVLNLYKILLERKVLLHSGHLTQWTYKNISTVGIRLHEYEWTEQFIHQFKSRLAAEDQHNAYTYNLAAFYYATQAYKKALQQLQDVKFTDDTYHLGAKIIQLKSYYELDEGEAFLSLIEAFKRYIQRNRSLSDYRKKANAHFLYLARRIFLLKQQLSLLSAAKLKRKARTIRQKMSSLQPIANKDWLEEVFDKIRQDEGG